MNIKKAMLSTWVAGMLVCITTPLKAEVTGPPVPVFSKSSITKAKKLLASLTLEEKIGQMNQLTITSFESSPGVLDEVKLEEAILKYNIGSILNVPGTGAVSPKSWAKLMAKIEAISNKTDKKIPILYGIDAIHGSSYTSGATLFPQQIGMAATWNTDLVEQGTRVSAYETRASSIPWVFSPDLDLPRSPVWSRLWESFGEDTYLSKTMGVAMVKGFEGDNVGDKYNVATCIKHFVGYGSTVTGRDRTPSIIPDRVLQQFDLPIFKAAIDAKAKSIMISSGEINGTPVHASKKLLTTILKEQLGFQGMVLTDWQDIIYLHTRHKVAKNNRDAVKMAVNAGIDMSMVPDNYTFYTDLLLLVKSGEVPMSRIDDAVLKILSLKYELGLFDQPFVAKAKAYDKFGSAEHETLAYNAAAESITLLKNKEAILPLSKNKKILVTGPTANSMKFLNGGWTFTWQGEKADTYEKDEYTILEAFEEKIGKENVNYVQGVEIFKELDITEAVKKAENVDVIVLCIGEHNYTETPGDIMGLAITEPQQKLAEALIATGKPIVLVLNEGRPRTITSFETKTNATIQCYLPGSEGSRALIDIIYGDVNPSGRLPYNYPRFTNSLQKYNRKYTESLGDEEQNDDADYQKSYNPLYEFGAGLSYTTFEYTNLTVDKTTFSNSDTITVNVTIKNTGKLAGKEVVQLYLTDKVASITPEVKSLRAYQKINLTPGESKTINFNLNPEDFMFVNEAEKWVAEPGEFVIKIDSLTKTIELK
ncbi:glycoside hydrolase family 3 N-terminal domain-containing protein [Aquimarina agarivorans]|uniref:glycoside hydrolase family 3 N-terminal domain-containing protein n=1 Tax=Aquimarina agarivorans TaxID=980584 RepID=UPI000248F5D0|nr:glycoside hydrolase family 3 N-terminal domain-containing protein [Aquimarina agarivorans]